MHKEALLSDLLSKTREYVNVQGYCKGTWYYYNAGLNSLQRHFEHNSEITYSRDIAWAYVLERRIQYENGHIAYATFHYSWKVAEMLEELSQTGHITLRKSQAWNFKRPCPVYEALLRKYEKTKQERGRSISTLVAERSAIRHLLRYLESKGITDISKIKRIDISEYIPVLAQQNPAGISGILTRLRSFFRYLIGEGLLEENLLYSLQLQAAVRKKVRLGFTPAEADNILNAVDQSTNVGKRDYAILLLAKQTGLRAVDVIHLKLRDIDWNNGEIRIIQHKTQRPLILPLENNVGNAIADYILNARPESSLSEIFLRAKAPYLALGQGNGTSITRKYAKRAGVVWASDAYKGFHSFRRSIGTSMLAADVPLSTISEVLGHSHSDSTKPYLSADLKNLKMCALPLGNFGCTKEELQ